jgi:AcrR family transcriptional regulator
MKENSNEIKKVQGRSEETKRKILKTSALCFSNKSYSETSVDEICELANVSKGAFFYHFPTKKMLFLELLDGWLESLNQSMEEIVKSSPDMSDALLKMTGIIKTVTDSSGGKLPLFLQFWSEATHDREIWNATVSYYKKYRKYFSKIIERGVKEGSFKKVDSNVAANVIVSFAIGFLLQELVGSDGENWEKASKEGFEMILKILKR